MSNPVYAVRGISYVGAFVLYVTLLAADLWWLSKALRGAPSPTAVYLPVTLFAAFSAGNAGSSVNYLIEPIVALCLALPSTGQFDLVITAYEFLPTDAERALRESFTLKEVVLSPVGLTFKVYRFKR